MRKLTQHVDLYSRLAASPAWRRTGFWTTATLVLHQRFIRVLNRQHTRRHGCPV